MARHLVRALTPEAVSGHTAEDIVTAKVDYGLLDVGDSPVRIRLNSTVVRARNVGEPGWHGVRVMNSTIGSSGELGYL